MWLGESDSQIVLLSECRAWLLLGCESPPLGTRVSEVAPCPARVSQPTHTHATRWARCQAGGAVSRVRIFHVAAVREKQKRKKKAGQPNSLSQPESITREMRLLSRESSQTAVDLFGLIGPSEHPACLPVCLSAG